MNRLVPVSIALLGLPLVLGAQVRDLSPAAMEMDLAGKVWFNSDNAAGMILTPRTSFEAVGVSYDIENGSYRKYADGNVNTLGVKAEGASTLSRGLVWGEFRYSNITVNDSRYNAMTLNIDEDMPFRVVDEIESYWKNQRYDLSMKASTPLYWDFLSLGISADYYSESGAKQIDPRGYGYENQVVVKPAAAASFGAHSLGLVFDYEFGNTRMGCINSAFTSSNVAYLLKGLGNMEESVVSLISGRFGSIYDRRHQFGGALQYGFSSGAFGILAEGKYNSRNWDCCETPSKPLMLGESHRKTMEGNVQLTYDGASLFHKFTLNGKLRNTDGIEYVQVFNRDYEVQAWEVVAKNVRSRYKTVSASLCYELYSKSGAGYSWMAGAAADFSDRAEEYILPASDLGYTNCSAGLYGKKNFIFRGVSILAGADASYSMNLGGDYNYSGSSAESAIVTDLYPNTLAYYMASFLKCGLNVNVSFPLGEKTIFNISADVDYISTDNEILRNRTLADITIGFTF